MDKSTPFRLLFYEAPRYDENGDLVYPEPVVVVRRVSEVRLGLRWIRRRLGLRAYGKLIEGCRFRDEILPLPDPVNPLALSTTQVPAKLTDAILAAGQPTMVTPTVGSPVTTTEPAAAPDLSSPSAIIVPEESIPALSLADLDQLPTTKPVEKITFAPEEDLLLPTAAKPHVIDLDSLSATVAAEIKPETPEPVLDLEKLSSLESTTNTVVPTDGPSPLAPSSVLESTSTGLEDTL
jgi:hypothetical protein